jgi:3-hydroxyacyl-[acyl-carrier-protein] dehydratase
VTRLAGQVRECMSDLAEADDGSLTARFVFPPDFLGFQGHFPGNPVLPAVCEIQGAVAMLEAWENREVSLREIILAKFSAPVTCNEEVVYSCSMTTEDGRGAVVRATIAKQGRVVAKFRLRVVSQGETEGC